MLREDQRQPLRLRTLTLANIRCIDQKTLNFFDLSGAPHDQVVLMGPSGSGKSSVLLALAHLCELLDGPGQAEEPYGPRVIRLGTEMGSIAAEFQLGAVEIAAQLALRGSDSPWLRPVTALRQTPSQPRLAWPPRGRMAYVPPQCTVDIARRLAQFRWRSQRLAKDESGQVPLHPALLRLRSLFAALDSTRRSPVFFLDSDEVYLCEGSWPANIERSCAEFAASRATPPLPIRCASDGERATFELAAQLTLREVPPEVLLLDEPLCSWEESRRARIIQAVRQCLPSAQIVVATSSRAIQRSVHDYERLNLGG